MFASSDIQMAVDKFYGAKSKQAIEVRKLFNQLAVVNDCRGLKFDVVSKVRLPKPD
jgi:hypothetical protein